MKLLLSDFETLTEVLLSPTFLQSFFYLYTRLSIYVFIYSFIQFIWHTYALPPFQIFS